MAVRRRVYICAARRLGGFVVAFLRGSAPAPRKLFKEKLDQNLYICVALVVVVCFLRFKERQSVENLP